MKIEAQTDFESDKYAVTPNSVNSMKYRSPGSDMDIPYDILPLEQLELSDEWVRKTFFHGIKTGMTFRRT